MMLTTRAVHPSALRVAVACVASLFATGVFAQVTISEAWVRGTVGGQLSTGAYMRLAAAQNATLVAVSSPVARKAEMHESRMDNGVMRMRAIGQLPLPAGKSVELKPNGYHVMLLDLTRPLSEGDAVPLILTVLDASGTKTNLQVNAVVRPLTAGADEAPAKHTH